MRSGGANRRNRLTEEDLIQGDPVYVRRVGLLYSHHGIYAGEETVIHFKGEDKEKQNPVVILTGIESFLNGGKLRRRNYKKRIPHSESFLYRQYTGKKLKEIGLQFGIGESGVSQSCKRVVQKIEKDKQLKKKIDRLEK